MINQERHLACRLIIISSTGIITSALRPDPWHDHPKWLTDKHLLLALQVLLTVLSFNSPVLGAENPTPNKVNLLNYGRIM